MAISMYIMKPIKEVSIGNFKGIAKCGIKDISKINLFIGKNDSGKSSIIEALFFMTKEYVGNTLSSIMPRRTDVFTGGRELWFGYNTNVPIDISIKFDNGEVLGLAFNSEKDQISTKFYGTYGVAHGKKAQPWKMGGSIYMGRDFSFSVGKEKVDRLPIPQRAKDILRMFALQTTLVDCRNKSAVSEIERDLATVKLKGTSRKLGSIISKCYGKGANFEFFPHVDMPNEVRLAIKEAGRTMFVSDLGDGFRLGLALLSKLFTRISTCVFIEEIESHQHIGSLRSLLPAAVEIARKNNLQLFITTHSADVWNSLSRGVYLEDPDREKEEFRAFIVERNPRTGVVLAERSNDVAAIDKALGHS